ncbi:MAG: T9SS type A sorting domain-containing protein, partial [Chitinophagales bacterium]
GNVDPAFNTYFSSSSNDEVYDLELQDDGKILVSGIFTKYNGDLSFEDFIRLNTDGTLDYTMALTFNESINESQIWNDDKIFVKGGFETLNGNAVKYISALNSDGTTYTSFNAGTSLSTIGLGYSTIGFDMLDRVYIGFGGTNDYNGSTIYSIGRINTDGTLDESFHPSGEGPISSEYGTALLDVVTFNSGNIAYVGNFYKFDTKLHNNIVLIDSIGNLSPLMPTDKGFDAPVYETAIQSDGKIISVGAFKKYGDITTNGIARINTDGTLDATFVASISGAQTLAIQSDGKILVGGKFSNVNGTSKNDLVRLNSDGTIDATFSSGSGVTGGDNSITAIKILSDGKLLAAGSFSNYNGTLRNDIVRLFDNGSLDTSFDPGAGCDNKIFVLAEDSAGNYLVGGAFSQYQYTDVGVMFRVLPDGLLDTTFVHTMENDEINDIIILSDEKIMVGGAMKYEGTTNRHLLRLFNTGCIDPSFVPGFDIEDVVEDIFLNEDGRMYVSGNFNSYAGNTCYNLALINSDASFNSTFNTTKFCDASATHIEKTTDGKLIISGDFQSINGASRNYIARLYASDSTPPVCTTPTGVTATSITTTTAKIKWDAMADALNYRLQYRVLGTTPWTTKVSTTIQKKIKTLAPSTTYEYHVRSECADAEVSAYSAIQTFTTLPLREAEDTIHGNISIYPNPSNGNFIIQFPIEEDAESKIISVKNILGDEIYSIEIKNDAALIQEIQLPKNIISGIYFVEILMLNKIFLQQIVVE